ncbi:MAG: 50S ribosomal protein L3 [Planctomycetes bacterium]|nr:50S ribosomal protein L3 [Planctomycetota bacterium]
MALGLLGIKVGMTQIFDAEGKLAPVTVIETGPCNVLQIRTPERDKYHAIQLGFKDKLRRKAIRAERGHVAEEFVSKRRAGLRQAGVQVLEKADCEPQRFIKEFRLEGPPPSVKIKEEDGSEKDAAIEVGFILYVDQVFKEGQHIDVIGTTKGRGYTGVMKRHNFQGLPAAHGAKKVHRSPGSTGSHASNRGSGRPKKGHLAAGQYGNTQVTIRNLDVVKIDIENNLLIVRGAIPGPNGGLVIIRPTNKKDIPSPEARAKAEAAKKKGKGVKIEKKAK